MHIIFPLLFAGLTIDRWGNTSAFNTLIASINKVKVPHASHKNLEEVVVVHASTNELVILNELLKTN